MQWLQAILSAHREIAFFLVLGIGYLLGNLALGGFKLGAVTGTLLAGVIVGQLGITLPNEVKECFFLLFLFSIGYRTGPQFFRGLRTDGLAHAALAALVATTGILVSYVVARLFGYDTGTAAGLFAGSMTESAAIGTAMDAIGRFEIAETARMALANNIPVAFAVTYLVGMTVAAWFLSQLAPRLMGIDLAEECRKLEQQMQGPASAPLPARREFELRAYAVDPGSKWIDRALLDLESSTGAKRMFVERLRRGGQVLEVSDRMLLAAGDIIAVSGRRQTLVEAAVRNGAKGIVVAGVGGGNMTAPVLDALTKAAKVGTVVVRSTRLPQGIVLRNNEVDDDELGFVASGELNPAKSRVLLQLALTKTKDPTTIQRMFNEY